MCHYIGIFTSTYQKASHGLFYLKTGFAKYVQVGKGHIVDGFHGNWPHYFIYVYCQYIICSFLIVKAGIVILIPNGSLDFVLHQYVKYMQIS